MVGRLRGGQCAVGAILWITPSIKPAAKHDGKNPPYRVERKTLRRRYHMLREELGEAALALPDTRP